MYPLRIYNIRKSGGLVTIVAVLFGGFGVSSVYGQGSSSTTNFQQHFESPGLPLCGGEEVIFRGTTHFVFHETVTANGQIHTKMHMNYMKTEAIGVTSADKYVIREVSNFVVNANSLADESGVSVFHTVINGKLIHVGKDINTGFKMMLQTVLGPDGDIKTEVEKVEIRCNGS